MYTKFASESESAQSNVSEMVNNIINFIVDEAFNRRLFTGNHQIQKSPEKMVSLAPQIELYTK